MLLSLYLKIAVTEAALGVAVVLWLRPTPWPDALAALAGAVLFGAAWPLLLGLGVYTVQWYMREDALIRRERRKWLARQAEPRWRVPT